MLRFRELPLIIQQKNQFVNNTSASVNIYCCFNRCVSVIMPFGIHNHQCRNSTGYLLIYIGVLLESISLTLCHKPSVVFLSDELLSAGWWVFLFFCHFLTKMSRNDIKWKYDFMFLQTQLSSWKINICLFHIGNTKTQDITRRNLDIVGRSPYNDAGDLDYSFGCADCLYHLQPVAATCTPFTYIRGSACSDNLAASTFPACSSINLTTELDFCELQSNGDVEYLGSVARVLGRNMVSMIWILALSVLILYN